MIRWGGECLVLNGGSSSQLHGTDAFEDDLLQRIAVAEAFHCVEDLDAGDLSFGIVFERNTFGDLLGGDCRLLKENAQSIGLFIVTDTHGFRNNKYKR